MNNKSGNSHAGPLFRKSNILIVEDTILIGNIKLIKLISRSITNHLPPIFKNWFIFCSEIPNYDTVSSPIDKLFKPSYRTDSYGTDSIIIDAINKTQNILEVQLLKSLYPTKIENVFYK